MTYVDPAGDYRYVDPIKPGMSVGILNKPFFSNISVNLLEQ
jgi:hypothetical protein